MTFDGQRFVVASQWIKVPASTTYEDIHKYAVYESLIPDMPENTEENEEWQVTGSKGNLYTVKMRSGLYSCTCPGFGFRRKCKHVTNIKLTNPLTFES